MSIHPAEELDPVAVPGPATVILTSGLGPLKSSATSEETGSTVEEPDVDRTRQTRGPRHHGHPSHRQPPPRQSATSASAATITMTREQPLPLPHASLPFGGRTGGRLWGPGPSPVASK